MSLRILVVEDDPLMARIFRDVLRFAGHQVDWAATLDEAVGALSSMPALLLVDIEIPGGGGAELLRRVRADDRFAHVPLVAVTGHSAPEDHDRFLAMGFDEHAGKPLDVRALPREVERWARLRVPTPPPGVPSSAPPRR